MKFITSNKYRKLTIWVLLFSLFNVTQTLEVYSQTKPTNLAIAGNLEFCEGDSTVLTVSATGTNTYKWLNDNYYDNNYNTSKVFKDLPSGTYESKVVASNPYGSDTLTFNIVVSASAKVQGSIETMHSANLGLGIPYTVLVKLNTYNSTRTLVNPEIKIRIPEGQKYKEGSLQITSPNGTCHKPNFIEQELNNSSIERTITINLKDITGIDTMPAFNPEIFDSSCCLFQFQANFVPECSTPLTGMFFEAVMSGTNLCGTVAQGSYKINKSEEIFPQFQHSYSFALDLSFVDGNRAFNEIKKENKLILDVTKNSGLGKINSTDFLQLRLPVYLDIKSVKINSTTTPSTVDIRENKVKNKTRVITLSFPANSINDAVNHGLDKKIPYEIDLVYTPDKTQTHLIHNPIQTIESMIITQNDFNANCTPSPSPAGKGIIDIALISAFNNPHKGVVDKKITMRILNPEFEGKWFAEEIGGTELGTGNTYVHTTSTPNSLTFFVEAKFSNKIYGRVPMPLNVYQKGNWVAEYTKVNDTIYSHVKNTFEYMFTNTDTIEKFRLIFHFDNVDIIDVNRGENASGPNYSMKFRPKYIEIKPIGGGLAAGSIVHFNLIAVPKICDGTISISSNAKSDYVIIADTAIIAVVKQNKIEAKMDISLSKPHLVLDSIYKVEINANIKEGLDKSEIVLNIPAGQKYIPKSYSLRSSTTHPVWDMDTLLVKMFGNEDSIKTGKSVRIEVFRGTNEIKFEFKPVCTTPLTGINFSAFISSVNKCGTDSNTDLFKSKEMYPAKRFEINQFIPNGNRAFNEIRKTEKINIEVVKTDNLTLNNFSRMFIYMPKSMNIKGDSIFIQSSDMGEINSKIAQIESNSIDGRTRIISMVMPSYNNHLENGKSLKVTFSADIEYTSDRNDDYIINNPEQIIKTEITTVDNFSNTCNVAPMVIGTADDIRVALVTAAENPYQCEVYDTVNLEIINPNFTGTWFLDGSAMLENVYMPTVVETRTFPVLANYDTSSYGIVPVILEVNPKELTLPDFTVANKIYDGTTFATINNIGELKGIQNGDDVSIDTPNITVAFADANSGNAKSVLAQIGLTGAKASLYTVKPNTTANIDKAPLSLTLGNETVTYTGTKLYISPASLTGIVGNLDFPINYTYTKDGISTNYAIDAGTYNVAASTLGDTNHSADTVQASFSVNKATPIINLTAKSVNYTGSPINIDNPIISGGTANTDLTFVTLYSGANYPQNTQAPTESGAYTVTVSTVGDKNHESANSQTTLTIGKGFPILTLSENQFIYDGTSKTITANVTPSTLNIDYSYQGIQTDGTSYPLSQNAPTNAGSYTITATFAGNDNYDATSATAILTISQASTTIAMQNKSTEFTGANIAIDVISIPANLPLTITYTKDGNTSETPPIYGGTYLVKASFVGNNNYIASESTANLTITTAGEPSMVLNNKTVIYNKQVQYIDSVILQAEAQYLQDKIVYTYSASNYPANTQAPINAGEYTVTATSPKDNNFNQGSISAKLTINKAEQTITFLQEQLNGKQLNEAPFPITATSNSDLLVSFISGNNDIAKVSSNIVTIKKTGTVMITAEQEGDINYNKAPSVSRTLNISSSDATLKSIVVNGKLTNVEEQMFYSMGCENIMGFDVELSTELSAKISVEGYEFANNKFRVICDKPMIKVIKITITSQDESNSNIYYLTVQKDFEFDHVVRTRWNNTLSVYNNPANNFDYIFTGIYKWYKNDELIYEGEYYSAGDKATDKLNPNDVYYVEMTTTDGIKLRTCTKQPELKSSTITAYPNPVSAGEIVYIKADVDPKILENVTVEVYNMSGMVISETKVTEQLTYVTAPNNKGVYIFKLKGKNGLEKSFKIIVK